MMGWFAYIGSHRNGTLTATLPAGAVVFQGHGIGAAITTHHTNLNKPLLCSPPQDRQICGKMISYIQLDAAVKKHMYTEANIHLFSIPPPLLLLSSSLLNPPPSPPPPPGLNTHPLRRPSRHSRRPRRRLINRVIPANALALLGDRRRARHLLEAHRRVIRALEPVEAPVAARLELLREAVAGTAGSNTAVPLAPAVGRRAELVRARYTTSAPPTSPCR